MEQLERAVNLHIALMQMRTAALLGYQSLKGDMVAAVRGHATPLLHGELL